MIRGAMCILSGITTMLMAPACNSSSAPRDQNHPASGGTAGSEASSGGSGGGTTQDADALPDAGTADASIPGADRCAHPEVTKKCSNGWCQIPAGCFIMGSPVSEWGHPARSENQVAVTITRAFEIQQTELTQAAWLELMPRNPTSAPDDSLTACLDPNCPVTSVTWFEALEYANRLSLAHSPPLAPCYVLEGCAGEPGSGMTCTGVTASASTVQQCAGYRLPTDAEWEYAARAGTRTAFFSGDITSQDVLFDCHSDPNLERIAWYCYNANRQAHVVLQKEANAWGLFDTSGNVDELVSDVWTGRSFTSPQVDPGGALEVAALRTRRNCSAISHVWACRSAMHAHVQSTGGPTTGFRLARTLRD